MSDELKTREIEDAELYPETSQGLEILNEAGEWVLGRKKEQFIAYAWGFGLAGIIRELNGNAVKVLNIITGFTNRFRNTTITDSMIIKYAGVCQKTLTVSLQELKYYHFLSIHDLPGGSGKKRRRSITVNRWDTALALLIKEKKIILGIDNKVVFLITNPYRK